MSKKDDVLDARRNTPSLSMAGIAAQVGVSRQGVYQTLKRYGFPTWITKTQFHCRICDIIVDREATFRYNKERCSKCRIKGNLIYAICDWCSKPIIRRVYLDRGKYHWCNQHCHGAWLGNLKKGERKEANPIVRSIY